jgi:hypothetical protein
MCAFFFIQVDRNDRTKMAVLSHQCWDVVVDNIAYNAEDAIQTLELCPKAPHLFSIVPSPCTDTLRKTSRL